MSSACTHDVAVIGAGAAGLMAAAVAAGRGRRVVVLDHNAQPGRKILISGGGRCNFTNRSVTSAQYLSENPHFATSALKRFGADAFLDLVRAHRIAWHERDHGQLFCDHSASDILDMLLAECGAGSVEFRLGQNLGPLEGRGPFRLATPAGTVTAASVIVATGGLSLPKIGASGLGHSLARRYGLGVVETAPALAPLTFGPPLGEALRQLSGIAVPAEVCLGRARFREAVLFTHRGLSGPAILQISSYWKPGQPVTIDWMPGTSALDWLRERKTARPKAQTETVVAERLPARLARWLCAHCGLEDRPMGQMPDSSLALLARQLGAWEAVPSGTEGYRVAEATRGGVDTDGLSSKTMEAKSVPGLYFIGEVVDVTGWLGGYNFQWAWSSGWAAGQFA